MPTHAGNDAGGTKIETLDELMSRLETNPQGLTDDQAAARIAKYGYNELVEKRQSLLLKLLGYFWGPIPWMIEAAAVLSGIVRHWEDFVIILVLLAGTLGGALRATGVLDALVTSLLGKIRRVGSLIASVLGACYVVNLFTGNQALALILPGQMFLPVFRERRIDTSVLTRSLEDAGTLSAPLVPWGVAGGFCSQMLDVPTIDYLPFVWFAFAVPVFSLLLGYTGIAVWRTD